jgi:hypothetical protein
MQITAETLKLLWKRSETTRSELLLCGEFLVLNPLVFLQAHHSFKTSDGGFTIA